MADVRKLLQAERRLRETSKPKSSQGNARASTKRSLSETDEAAVTKRQRTTTIVNTAGLPADFFDRGEREGEGEEIEGTTTCGVLEPGSGDEASPSQNEGGGNVEVEDDASMAEAPNANTTSSTLPSNFFEAKSSISSTALVEVDEDEWAAFQADVAEAAAPITTSVTVIEAAPTTNNPAATVGEQDTVDDYAKGEEEDAKQKLLDEFEEMESLEQRVLRLKERREALKNKTPAITKMEVVEAEPGDRNFDEEEEDDDDDDFFRARGS